MFAAWIIFKWKWKYSFDIYESESWLDFVAAKNFWIICAIGKNPSKILLIQAAWVQLKYPLTLGSRFHLWRSLLILHLAGHCIVTSISWVPNREWSSWRGLCFCSSEKRNGYNVKPYMFEICSGSTGGLSSCSHEYLNSKVLSAMSTLICFLC